MAGLSKWQSHGTTESRIYGTTEVCSIAADKRIHETSDLQTFMENKKKTYTKKGNYNKRAEG